MISKIANTKLGIYARLLIGISQIYTLNISILDAAHAGEPLNDTVFIDNLESFIASADSNKDGKVSRDECWKYVLKKYGKDPKTNIENLSLPDRMVLTAEWELLFDGANVKHDDYITPEDDINRDNMITQTDRELFN